MRGRRPSGPEFVDKLSASDKAKTRLKILLETMTGDRRVLEACDLLGIGEARFDQLRLTALAAALEALEDRPAGRPSHTPTTAEQENAQLRERIAQLEAERIHVCRVRWGWRCQPSRTSTLRSMTCTLFWRLISANTSRFVVLTT